MRPNADMPGAGRVVVVTGASAGLGRAIGRRFASGGCSVALLARGETGLDGAAHDIASFGSTSLALSVDVANWSAVQEAARRIEDALGPIDVWINNAMTSIFAPFSAIAMEDFERATRVNYLGFVHGRRLLSSTWVLAIGA